LILFRLLERLDLGYRRERPGDAPFALSHGTLARGLLATRADTGFSFSPALSASTRARASCRNFRVWLRRLKLAALAEARTRRPPCATKASVTSLCSSKEAMLRVSCSSSHWTC
jgi:hypothetical protein